jgi:hypothetical protein
MLLQTERKTAKLVPLHRVNRITANHMYVLLLLSRGKDSQYEFGNIIFS